MTASFDNMDNNQTAPLCENLPFNFKEQVFKNPFLQKGASDTPVHLFPSCGHGPMCRFETVHLCDCSIFLSPFDRSPIKCINQRFFFEHVGVAQFDVFEFSEVISLFGVSVSDTHWGFCKEKGA